MDILTGYVKSSRDLKTVQNLAYTLFCNVPKEKTGFLDTIQPWISNPSKGLVTAYDGDDVVGFVMHGPIRGKDTAPYQRAGESLEADVRQIAFIGVDRSAHRRQIGKTLLSTATDECQTIGASRLYAICLGGKQGASYPLFTRSGFDELATYEKLLSGTPGTIVRKHLA